MNTNDQLTQFLELIRTDVINALQAAGKNTTGQTAKQINIVNDGDKLQLQLPGYMQLLETGRGPTSPDAQPGNPPMIHRIQEWCRSKGIPDKAAWAIKKSIDKKGFKGIPGLLTEPLGEENVTLRIKPFMENIAAEIASELAGTLS